MKKITFTAAFFALFSNFAIAEENTVIDPADVTNVYTQAALLINGSSDFQLQAQVSGGMDNGQQFALLAEATFVDENGDRNDFGTEYSNSRFQYFHVFDTGLAAAPKAGISLDYINTRTKAVKNDLFAIGGVMALNPKYTAGLMVFPLASVMTGSMEIPGLAEKDDLTGYGLGLMAVKRLGEGGAYIAVIPEWQDLSGDEIDMQNLAIKTSFNAPLNASRKWWINTRFDITKSSIDVAGVALDADWETEAWIGVRHYF